MTVMPNKVYGRRHLKL